MRHYILGLWEGDKLELPGLAHAPAIDSCRCIRRGLAVQQQAGIVTGDPEIAALVKVVWVGR
jgi:hypothetical protein